MFGIDLLDSFIPVKSIIWSSKILPFKCKRDFTSSYKNQIKIMNLEHGKEPKKIFQIWQNIHALLPFMEGKRKSNIS